MSRERVAGAGVRGARASAPPVRGGARPAPSALQLQQAAGNSAVRRLLAARTVQAKLSVGRADDPLEAEADRVADQVLRAPEVRVQRSCGCGGTCAGCEEQEEEEKPQVRRRGGGAAMEAPPEVERAAWSGGRPLDPGLRAYFEGRFGADLGGLRIHTGPEADAAARSVRAEAFTIGQEIVFGERRFDPATERGRRLLAHEIVHTLQQGGSAPALLRRAPSHPNGTVCAGEPGDKFIKTVVVEQETPQSVTLHWSDGSVSAGEASTGKGHCCVEPSAPDGVACTAQQSQVNGSNCTPITEGKGLPVQRLDAVHNGIEFWTEFLSARGIALHDYDPEVDGTPLSHGCVRLHRPFAKELFCGARVGRTTVQVIGFARPRCNHGPLQFQWMRDFRTAGLPLDGEGVDVKNVRETRKTLMKALGSSEEDLLELTGRLKAETGEYDVSKAAIAKTLSVVTREIPRCASRGASPTVEEGRVAPGKGASAPSEPARILAGTPFELRGPALARRLAATGSMPSAKAVVIQEGNKLWLAATAAAQNSKGADTDDRLLYWSRLEMARTLRQWVPRFKATPADRAVLQVLFERASRGMEDVYLHTKRGVKRILISGFDPFDLDQAIAGGNPSAAAVLALDGLVISSGSISAKVQGVLFPVRYEDFDAGMVESFFRPFLDGSRPVDMIMTISRGTEKSFEVEEFAARNRSAEALDNLRREGGGSPSAPISPPGLAAGPEFLQTTLPAGAIRTALGRAGPLPEETEITEIPAGVGAPRRRQRGGPTAGSTSVQGSGGGYLSNEIFYRTRLLRDARGSTVPMGHLHTPRLEPPSGGISSPTFVVERDAIAATVKKILEAVLPHL